MSLSSEGMLLWGIFLYLNILLDVNETPPVYFAVIFSQLSQIKQADCKSKIFSKVEIDPV